MDTHSPSPLSITSNKQDRWPQIVSRYSELALAFDADRLPALSGLASRLASIMGFDYLAGLWKSDLERLLGWA
jgi:hypothetical protein